MIDTLLQKFGAAQPQIDFGNLTVGIATLTLACVTIIVSLRSGAKQKNQKIAEFRKEWVEDLRSKLAEFDRSNTIIVIRAAERTRARKNKEETRVSELNSIISKCLDDQLYSARYVYLMLNQKEPQHAMLRRKMKSMTYQSLKRLEIFERHKPADESDFDASDLPSFEELSRSVLKLEWNRLKSEV